MDSWMPWCVVQLKITKKKTNECPVRREKKMGGIQETRFACYPPTPQARSKRRMRPTARHGIKNNCTNGRSGQNDVGVRNRNPRQVIIRTPQRRKGAVDKSTGIPSPVEEEKFRCLVRDDHHHRRRRRCIRRAVLRRRTGSGPSAFGGAGRETLRVRYSGWWVRGCWERWVLGPERRRGGQVLERRRRRTVVMDGRMMVGRFGEELVEVPVHPVVQTASYPSRGTIPDDTTDPIRPGGNAWNRVGRGRGCAEAPPR